MAKPNPDSARLLAWEIFFSVQSEGGYSNIILPQGLADSELDARDKSFVTELVYGALRMQGHADYVLNAISDRPLTEIDQKLRILLRLALYQTLHMRIPAHAAVSANVELARKVIGESKASFVNAILRKASQRTCEEWLENARKLEDPISRLAIVYSHPEWIVSAYMDLLKDGEEVEKALEANNLPAQPTLVAWPDSCTHEELIAEGGEAVRFSPLGVVAKKPPHEFSAIRQRRAGVQDEGSQIVASAFYESAKGKDQMIDLCAGPGGKAALLSRWAKRDGKIFVANEFSQARARLVENVVPYGEVRVGDARELEGQWSAILADVPCTGIGALRRRPEVRWRRDPAQLSQLIHLQFEIASRALASLTPGGILGYATCSPHLLETRGVVDNLLRKNGDIEEIRVPIDIPDSHMGLSMQLWTHRHNTDAMFLALLRKRNTL